MIKNLTVKDLKNTINDLPDDMILVIPVIDEDDSNIIHGFRIARTAAILKCESENPDTVLCINTADTSIKNIDITEQIKKSNVDSVEVVNVLFKQEG